MSEFPIPAYHDPRVSEIQEVVCHYYHLALKDFMSARRAREVARPRQVAMYLSKHLTLRSLPEIGRLFGGRDHTTVIHAVRTIEKLAPNDPDLTEAVLTCAAALGGVVAERVIEDHPTFEAEVAA